MCGIGGIFKLSPFEDRGEILDMSIKMLRELEDRGKDATGVAVINTFNDSFKIFKKNKHASEFIKLKEFQKLFLNNKYNIVLLHTRAKTQGSADNPKNNHPIFSKRFNNLVIHNGVINNDDDLKKKHGIKPDGEVDSEIILQMFNLFKQNKIEKAIKNISGSMAFALYDKQTLYLYKNTQPIFLAYSPSNDLFLFSSTKTAIKSSISEIISYYNNLFLKLQTKEKYRDFLLREIESNTLIQFKFEDKIKTSVSEIESKQKLYDWSNWYDYNSSSVNEYQQYAFEACLNCKYYIYSPKKCKKCKFKKQASILKRFNIENEAEFRRIFE